jgi:hypothetical protein
VIPTLPRRPDRFWIGMGASGKASPLPPKDPILSADEKTSIQARIRCYPSLPPAQTDQTASSTSTSAAVPCAIWPPGMFAGGT